MFNWKVFLAEFIGTFALVFVGAAAGMYNVGLLGVALAHGLTLAVFVYAYGHISGAHINPAVTLGLAANGNIKWVEAVVYWVAQFLGAVAAAFLLRTVVTLISPEAFAAAATNGVLNTDEFRFYALGVEALLTFFLVNTVLHTGMADKANPGAGLAIGATLAIAILAGGPLTGASLNPARTFGPAVFLGTWNQPNTYLIYFVGPFIGAIVAVLVHNLLNREETQPFEIEEEEEEIETDVEVLVEAPVVKKSAARKPAVRKTKIK